MPEGDTLARTAAVLRAVLEGRTITAARGRPGGAPVERLTGQTVVSVEAVGKHLLVGTRDGLTLHTHLAMRGSWHRYRAGEPWRRSAGSAVAVLEVPGAVAVCFSAPTVEVLETRVLAVHPVLSRLGPDLLDETFDAERALRRLRDPVRSNMAVGDALLDQGAVAGIGNVYRSEVCFLESVDPFAPVGTLDDMTLRRLLGRSRDLLRANLGGPFRTTVSGSLDGWPGPMPARVRGERVWVYGRTGRPCRRCGSLIRSRASGPLARRVYWCPRCQAGAQAVAGV